MGRLNLQNKKPSFSLDHPIFCDFRSSKAYLWGLVNSLLSDIVSNSSTPLYCLDAACHSLLTRSIFPEEVFYYGIDVSKNRLKNALSKLREGDQLYLADLTKNLPLFNSFDLIVSLNTISHIPCEQRLFVLDNLFNCLTSGGTLFVNLSIDSSLPDFTSLLLSKFKVVQPIYFESIGSRSLEDRSLVSKSNVRDHIINEEFSYPNDASIHYQVLFICREYSASIGNPGRNYPPSAPEILQLNTIPNTSLCTYDDDLSLVSDQSLLSKTDLVLMSSLLYSSNCGVEIRSALQSLAIPTLPMSPSLSIPASSKSILILGLENSWSSDFASDRLVINLLRSDSSISTRIAYVKSRDGQTCTPSLLMGDL